ncbi:unnamed protein product [Mytilus coruscus]|uniref:Fucolectin tachylectin-4 pentraxin-1 domain-containing protein n=1 Tax=Mytilus coruscus TaxID=42192 RepID=A0A6J8AVZ3_MYTCO|nr:unnamed protein product [Mytilus coruscus]
MCFVKDMNYISVFINAIVVALMAIYVYQNEKRMEEIAANHNQTENNIISDLGPKSLALERIESKLNDTSAILNRHDGILQAILEAEQRGNITTAILNSHSDMLLEILTAVRRDQNIAQLREMREIAYGKQTRQSSDHKNDYASASVDRNLDTFSHTNFDESPYLEVDLGNEFQIKRIDIFNRKHCCGERLHNLDITIGPSMNHMYLCAHYKGPGRHGEHLIFECVHNTKYARYVRLTIKGREFLHVAENIVGPFKRSCLWKTNQAKFKTNTIYASRFAVDGQLDTMTHTHLEQSPYWEVDLGKAYKIKRVEIFNRKDCCGERLHDLDITFGPAQNHMSLCAHYKGPGQNGEHLIFQCQRKNKYARYVKLMIKGREILNISEVKVYAEDD